MKSPCIFTFRIGISILLLFFCTSNCLDSNTLPPGVNGTILIWGKRTFVFDPVTETAFELQAPNKYFQPTFQCKGELDTLIISSQNPLDAKEGLSGYFKVVPFESIYVRIDGLGDDVRLPGRLDFLPSIKTFLFFGKINSDSVGLYLLDSNATIKREIGQKISSHLTPGQIVKGYLKDSTKILMDFGQRIYEYSLTDSSLRYIKEGKLNAISHNREMIIISIGHPSDRLNKLIHLNDDKQITLPPIEQAGFCFSPDDSYLACLHQTNDLYNTVELHIYDIMGNKMYRTNFTGAGTIVWVNKQL